MTDQELQKLVLLYADIIMRDKIGVVMAVRAYGACVASNEKPALATVERFYEAIKYTLEDEYKTVIHYMDMCDQIALERAIARRVYDIIQDMLTGCVR